MYCTSLLKGQMICSALLKNPERNSKMEEQRRLVAKLINDHNAANSTHNAVKKVSHKVDPTLYYLTIIQLE